MSAGLDIAFAGTPAVAAQLLNDLLNEGRHEVRFVLTRPDRPAGRGKRLHASPVKQLALGNDLPVFQPVGREDMLGIKDLTKVDVLVVVAYGMILEEAVLNRPGYGCINVHFSLLPRWRGAAPVQHAIMSGDTETGVTIMQMDAGLDSGPVLLQETCSIDPRDTAGTLMGKLEISGSRCLLSVLDKLSLDQIHPVEQDEAGATYAGKVDKTDARIVWNKSTEEIDRLVRAMNPSPVAFTDLNGISFRVLEAVPLEADGRDIKPGSIVSNSPAGLDIGTGNGVLRVLKLQMPGKNPLAYRDFYNGNPDLFNTAP